MSVYHHGYLHLTPYLEQKWRSGPFMSLQCADLLLTAPIFQCSDQISWIPERWCHILMSILRARPLVLDSEFIFLAGLQKA